VWKGKEKIADFSFPFHTSSHKRFIPDEAPQALRRAKPATKKRGIAQRCLLVRSQENLSEYLANKPLDFASPLRGQSWYKKQMQMITFAPGIGTFCQ